MTTTPAQNQPVLFCNECGIELDSHDVDANLATWDVFKNVCTDCIESVDLRDNPPKRSVAVYNGRIIYGDKA